MRILDVGILSAYAKRKPHAKRHLLAFRALVSTAQWRRLQDVEEQFERVAVITPPGSVAFDFEDEDLRIDMRVNCAIGLARIVSAGPSAGKTGRKN